jgi:hypothetical protein
MSPRDAAQAPLGVVRRDERDLRDRHYEPTLTPLSPRLDPERKLLEAIRATPAPPLPRQQGPEGSCGGHALAALIDIERLRATLGGPRPAPVSARMLQTMASRHDGSRLDNADGVSLRDVIKGFYNYGVCPEERWPYTACDLSDLVITPDRAKSARDVALGAYYRLRPNLNLYHSALRESGAVLVSAELHDGWSPEAMGGSGKIARPRDPGAGGHYSGGHAFVLVGYDPEGFLVLNSWGRDWGGFPIAGTPYPGIAHWSYGDWADSIMDGWALRLGVRAPEAFEFSIGEMGLGVGGPVRGSRGGAPVRAILGHYLHLDDGAYVARGAFPSDRAGLAETMKLIAADAEAGAARRYRGLLVTFAGALLNLADAAAQIAQLKAVLWKEREAAGATWYPITALWCVDYVDEARAVLEGVFAQALAQVGKPGPDLDRLIESRAHGVGRALWRDIRGAAERAAAADGPLVELADAATAVAAREPDFGLRVVAEGEGAFAFAALIARLARRPDGGRAFFRMLRSVDLVAPPLAAADIDALARRLGAGWRASGRPGLRPRLHLPTAADQARLAVPPYGKPYATLVQRAFVARPGAAPEAEDMSWEAWRGRRRVTALPIRWPAKAQGDPTARIAQRDLVYGSDVIGRVQAALAGAD